MAVRPLQPQDGGIVERRLRPIYDWLDNGNNKKALQEAEKVLKKAPSLQAAKALKALALFRLGRGPEAQVVLDALADEKPSDDSTLQAMTISYRESQQIHKVCGLYENAVKAEPLSEDLYTHLFMSYVRVGDYKAQQRSAMALYKIAPKSPYYCWAVMSIVLQAKAAEDSKQKGILLALAQRMVENYMSEDKMEAEQETRLYIMILELQEKWEDIIKFLDSPRYAQIVPSMIPQAVIPYLKKVGDWKRLNTLCKDLLYENADRWDYYMPYFDSVFELMKKTEPELESTADDTPEKCHEFICQLVEGMSSGKLIRGPYLARLELWRRLSVEGDPVTILGSGVALCIQYLRVFAHKPCALPDLRPYLPMLPKEEREERSREFLTCLDFNEDSEPDTVYDVQRHISCLSLWRVTAPPLPPEESLAFANKLRTHYLRSLKNGLVQTTPTEFCAADGYGVLAAHHYFYAAVQKQDTAPILEALGLLELLLFHSPSNFHAKLLLVKLYHMLGNALAADTIYQKLEIKHIQLVSLGWMHAARLAPSCASSKALQLLADTRAFHSHQAKDSAEHLTYAYRYGTFEKLVELAAWSQRIEACAWGACAGRSRALLALLAGPPQPLHAPRALHLAPTDNRDLNVIVNYEPPEAQDPELKTRTFDQDVAYLRLKDGLVSALALCIELADGRTIEEKQPQFEELKTCIEAFGIAMQKCRELYNTKERISISAPFPSRIIAFVNSEVPYRELYTTTLLMVGSYCVGQHSSAHTLCDAVTLLLNSAEQALPPKSDIWDMRDRLEHLSNYLEFIGIISFLLGVCNEITVPTNTKKSKKKVQKSPDEVKSVEVLSKLNQLVQNNIKNLENIFDDLQLYTSECTLEKEFVKLCLDDKFLNPVVSKLHYGRLDMIADVKNILKNKAKYLKSLIQ